MELNLLGLNDYFKSRRYESNIYKLYSMLFTKLINIINPDDVKYTYVRNLFNEGSFIETYLFLDNDKIIKAYIDENNHVLITLYRTRDITNIEYEGDIKDEYYGISIVNISFDNHEIVLNSSLDTNEGWRPEYNKLLTNIFKYLING